MSKIVIIGAGAMGTAFAFPCLDNNHDINIVGTHLENDFIDQLNKNKRIHPGLNTEIPQGINILKFDQFDTIFKSNVDLIVLGISSKGIEWVADQLFRIYKNKKLPDILMLTKGLSIYQNNYELLVDKLERLLSTKGIKEINISAVGGPCLATGLANRVHSSVVIANKDVSTAKKIASNEIREKNYLNTASALIKQSVQEMEIFVEHLKGKKETVKGLAGLGDLYVSSGGGRNSKMGSYIGEGMTFSEAKKSKMEKVTVEGADLAIEIGKKVNEDFDKKKLPLMLGMINAVIEDKKLEFDWQYFN